MSLLCIGLERNEDANFLYALFPVNAMKCCVCPKGFSDNSLGRTH
jgi:hypothetical protein